MLVIDYCKGRRDLYSMLKEETLYCYFERKIHYLGSMDYIARVFRMSFIKRYKCNGSIGEGSKPKCS